jgi:hypothetical protein
MSQFGYRHVAVEIDQGLQFDRQNLSVPAGIHSQLIVRQHVGAPLRLAQVGELQRWDARQA